MSGESDIYVDLHLNNSVTTSENQYVAASFMNYASQPILRHCNGHQLAIIRFTLDTQTLPIFEATVGTDNSTIYSFTMTYNGTIYQKYMTFIPQVLGEMRYLYSYQSMMYMVNQCLIECLSGLNGLIALPTTDAPIMSFNPDSFKASMALDSNFYGYNEANKINIYMNYSMAALFGSLPVTIIGNNNSGMNVQVNNLISADKNLLTQDFSTYAVWNPVQSIIFTSNLLPCHPSITPQIQLYQDGALKPNNSSFNFLNILTDFIGDNEEFKPFVQYNASIYRWIGLKSGASIKDIDIQIYWMNKFSGEIYPVMIGAGGSASVKILITKTGE